MLLHCGFRLKHFIIIIHLYYSSANNISTRIDIIYRNEMLSALYYVGLIVGKSAFRLCLKVLLSQAKVYH